MKRKFFIMLLASSLVFTTACGNNVTTVRPTETGTATEGSKESADSDLAQGSDAQRDECTPDVESSDKSSSEQKKDDSNGESSSSIDFSDLYHGLSGDDAVSKRYYDPLVIDGYYFYFELTNDNILLYSVFDSEGKEVGYFVQNLIPEEEYFDSDEIYDYQRDLRDEYMAAHAREAAVRQEMGLLEEIQNLTGKELKAEDKALVNKMISFMQNKVAYVPGAFSADYYDSNYKFTLLDVNKDGTRELFVDKGGGLVALYKVDGYWNSSLQFGDIRGINLDEGIILTIHGDMGGSKNYYKYDGTDQNIILQYTWVDEFSDDDSECIEHFYRVEADGTNTEVDFEEFDKAHYNEIKIDDSSLGWIDFNPVELLRYFFEVK